MPPFPPPFPFPVIISSSPLTDRQSLWVSQTKDSNYGLWLKSLCSTCAHQDKRFICNSSLCVLGVGAQLSLESDGKHICLFHVLLFKVWWWWWELMIVLDLQRKITAELLEGLNSELASCQLQIIRFFSAGCCSWQERLLSFIWILCLLELGIRSVINF